MPADVFIAGTITLPASDDEELIVEAVRSVRAHPGFGEYALFKAFNADLIANPPTQCARGSTQSALVRLRTFWPEAMLREGCADRIGWRGIAPGS